MRNINISNFRKNIFSYVNQAIDFNDTINVNTKNGNVIVMSEDEYNGLVETAYLNSIPGLAQALVERANAPEDEFVEVDWKNELQD